MKTMETLGAMGAPVLLTSGQAARYINVSPATLKRLVIIGELPVLPLTKDKRFRRADLDALASKSIEEMLRVRRKLAKYSQAAKAKTASNKKEA
jgi:excisionase family DNA binding protein